MWKYEGFGSGEDHFISASIICTPREWTADPIDPNFTVASLPPLSVRRCHPTKPSEWVVFLNEYYHARRRVRLPSFQSLSLLQGTEHSQKQQATTYRTLGHRCTPAELELQFQSSSELLVAHFAVFAAFPTAVRLALLFQMGVFSWTAVFIFSALGIATVTELPGIYLWASEHSEFTHPQGS